MAEPFRRRTVQPLCHVGVGRKWSRSDTKYHIKKQRTMALVPRCSKGVTFASREGQSAANDTRRLPIDRLIDSRP
jgi:hypothetical protein